MTEQSQLPLPTGLLKAVLGSPEVIPGTSMIVRTSGDSCHKIERVTLTPDLLPLPAQAVCKAAASTTSFAVAEFFAGIGLARLGLEQAGFKVTWANDMAADKKAMYSGHFGAEGSAHYLLEDIKVVAQDIVAAGVPRDLGLAWSSFPCTDLSLAGGRRGLAGKHSSTFWSFTDILEKLGPDKPPVVALENVNGFATSHGGNDLKAAVRKLNELRYSVDVLTLDARSWVPQSRPRLFLVGSLKRPLEEEPWERNSVLRPKWLDSVFTDPDLDTHRARLPEPPARSSTGWTDLVKRNGEVDETLWWDEQRMARFRNELSPVQLDRVAALEAAGEVTYRTAYRRTRSGVPAWEIRADDIAGCLRTTGGGSSKQAVVRIERGRPLRARWMTPREYACLMGADDYILPDRNNQALMGFGDAVCVNAVSWLAQNYLEPLLTGKLLPRG
ncbi:DNA cytosine methyltransferase [Streptomyces barkulensis]|uniref:DNA cytosine methyltransferase n=1 Tax=Streptomyces barkulensis TaxID=1257026 RepID=UPI001F0E1F0E|nr:DNA cytosine methyltransferase [Streptomyces barkulensis]